MPVWVFFLPVQTSSVSLLDGGTVCRLVHCSSGPLLAHRSNCVLLPQIYFFSMWQPQFQNHTVKSPQMLFLFVCLLYFFIVAMARLTKLRRRQRCVSVSAFSVSSVPAACSQIFSLQMVGRSRKDRGKEGAGDWCVLSWTVTRWNPSAGGLSKNQVITTNRMRKNHWQTDPLGVIWGLDCSCVF